MLVIKITVIVDFEQIELYDRSKYSFVFAQVISQISRNVTRNKWSGKWGRRDQAKWSKFIVCFVFE